MSFRNDARPGTNLRQQEAILGNRTALRNTPCPNCGKPTDSFPLKAFPKCVGRACIDQAGCGWQADEPSATLDDFGRLVETDAQGRSSGKVLLGPNGVPV